jgi:hypothetical protein
MASDAVDKQTGMTVSFTNFTYQLEEVTWGGIEVEVVQTTHLGTFPTATARTFIMGDMIDYGQVAVTFQVNPDTDFTAVVGTVADLTITFLGPDDASGALWVASCGLQSLSPMSSGGIDEKMMGQATFKVLAKPTITADAA